ncbi:MAG TPA: isochorismatase family cysteine hydrolase [Polyangiaceae bacterium]|nr:isochorismatase family cysteine hydrolase [Polyangiaceae bacterium]
MLDGARRAGALRLFVRVAFRPGYPEISARNMGFSALKNTNMFLLDAPETQIVSALEPRADEPVIIKHRVGAFGATALEPILRSRRIETLVLLGIATSGVVLSTLRHAADADYRIIAVADGCADADAEVHRVLFEKVFPRQATVATCEGVSAALGGQ